MGDLSGLSGLLSSPMMGIAGGLLGASGPSAMPQSAGMAAGGAALAAMRRAQLMKMLGMGATPQIPGMAGALPGLAGAAGQGLNPTGAMGLSSGATGLNWGAPWLR